jgi:hypothetical protein
MERTISIERLYSLGNYKNIKLVNLIDKIPESILANPEAMATLQFLLMVAVETDFRRYQKLNQEIGGMSLEESLEKLSEMRDDTYKAIQDLLQNGNITNTEENDNE